MAIHIRCRLLISPNGNIQNESKRIYYYPSAYNTIRLRNSYVSVSSGKYVASGQIAQTGYRAIVIIWDWRKRTELSRYQLHRVS